MKHMDDYQLCKADEVFLKIYSNNGMEINLRPLNGIRLLSCATHRNAKTFPGDHGIDAGVENSTRYLDLLCFSGYALNRNIRKYVERSGGVLLLGFVRCVVPVPYRAKRIESNSTQFDIQTTQYPGVVLK
jgi:hypothetical protein